MSLPGRWWHRRSQCAPNHAAIPTSIEPRSSLSSRRDQRKSPAKRRAGPGFGYAGDGLPSRCIRRYRLPSRCTRQKFHARPEQGNGPAADGASFSLTLKFIGVRKEPLFPSGTKTIRGLGNRSARFHHRHPSTVCVPRAKISSDSAESRNRRRFAFELRRCGYSHTRSSTLPARDRGAGARQDRQDAA
jgi:hypothetical protein